MFTILKPISFRYSQISFAKAISALTGLPIYSLRRYFPIFRHPGVAWESRLTTSIFFVFPLPLLCRARYSHIFITFRAVISFPARASTTPVYCASVSIMPFTQFLIFAHHTADCLINPSLITVKMPLKKRFVTLPDEISYYPVRIYIFKTLYFLRFCDYIASNRQHLNRREKNCACAYPSWDPV